MASGGSGHYFETPSETVPITEGDLVTQQELDVSAVEAVSSSGAAGLAQQKLLSLAESSAASETLSIQGPIGVISAEAFDPQWVRVLFSEDIDPTFAPFRDLSNYALNPALVVSAAIFELPRAVRLRSDPHERTTYTVTVGQARSIAGAPLSPGMQSADFDGLYVTASFYAVATKSNRVRLVFSIPMRDGPDLTDPSNFDVRSLSGASLGVRSVSYDAHDAGTLHIRGVALELSGGLEVGGIYRVQVGSAILADSGASGGRVFPDVAVFQWAASLGQTAIAGSAFSGETRGGLLAQHDGLVFFSPALEASIGDSIIEVDSVSVCTKAFEEYHFPQLVDPKVLYTFGSGPLTTLGGAVLWAPPHRLAEVRMGVGDSQQETVPPPVDSRAIATLAEPLDTTLVSLLNNASWKLFDNAGNPPAYFCTASNMAPIPPGPTTTRTLQP